MKILIVGAGATGTVFGAALAAGGAAVSYYVRPPHAARVAAGLSLYRQGWFGVTPHGFRPEQVLTSPADVAATGWDQVWFTTASDALRQPWLDDFLPATGRATLVVLQPDPEDIQYVRDHGAGDRLIVQGLIEFSAWQSPLPHEPADQQGITWLSPPGSAALFDSECAESATIVATLARGGLRAGARPDLPAHAARMSALVNPLIAGLELADWKIDRLRGHAALAIAIAASREAVIAESARHGTPVPLPMQLLLNGPAVGALLRLLPWVPGFNAEAFLHYHFSKVGRQTRLLLGTYRRHAENLGLPHGAVPPEAWAAYGAWRTPDGRTPLAADDTGSTPAGRQVQRLLESLGLAC